MENSAPALSGPELEKSPETYGQDNHDNAIDLDEVRQILSHFKYRDFQEAQELILSALQEINEHFGWVSLEAAELVAGLESTWSMVDGALARWTVNDLGHTFSPPAVLSEAERNAFGELTRQWIIWHVFEHEIYHGGELSLALGEYGLAGIYDSA